MPLKEGKGKVMENVQFSFQPNFQILESKQEGDKSYQWIKIGGVALEEGISENNNYYSVDNLQENDGKTFKWLYGHPDEPEEHVVGLGGLSMQEGKILRHEGKIRNTVRHPDVVEAVRDGFLGPSIHAYAKKVVKKGEKYHVEGLQIDGVGLVAFQGVKNASIEYALAESFNKKMNEKDEPEGDKNNNDIEVNNMSEDKEEKVEEQPQEEEKEQEKPEAKTEEQEEEKEEEKQEAKKQEETLQDVKALREELEEMKKKLEEKKSNAVVEEEEFKKEGLVVEDSGITYNREAYEKFNRELRERIQ